MPVETLDDVIESIADLAGVYGSCSEICDEGASHGDHVCSNMCRPSFVAEIKSRLLESFDVSRKLGLIE